MSSESAWLGPSLPSDFLRMVCSRNSHFHVHSLSDDYHQTHSFRYHLPTHGSLVEYRRFTTLKSSKCLLWNSRIMCQTQQIYAELYGHRYYHPSCSSQKGHVIIFCYISMSYPERNFFHLTGKITPKLYTCLYHFPGASLQREF